MKRAWYKRLFYEAVRLSSSIVGFLFFRLRITGQEFYPHSGGGLVCANHQSMLDPVLVGISCPHRLNYLARKSLFGFAPFALLINLLDAIPIEREGMGIGGLKETLRRLRRDEFVLIFPEGTRSQDGEIQPLQPGFVAVARRSKRPLIPVGLDGAFQAWPKKQRLPRPSRICVCVGPPISSEEIADWSDERIVEVLTERISACFLQARQSRRGEGLG